MNHPGNPTPTVLEKAYHLAQELDDQIRRGDEPIHIGLVVHEKLRAYRAAKHPSTKAADILSQTMGRAEQVYKSFTMQQQAQPTEEQARLQQLAGMTADPVRVLEGWRKAHAARGIAAEHFVQVADKQREADNPLLSFDARVWAREFMRLHSGKGIATEGGFDEGDAIAWFANALMRGFDEHVWQEQKKEAEAEAQPESRLANALQACAALSEGLQLALQVRDGALDAQAQAEKQFFAERQNHERTVAKLTELQKDLAQCQRDLVTRDTELSQLRPSAAPQADVLRAAACGLHRVIGCSVCFGRIGQEYR